MTGDEAVVALVEILNQLQIQYMISGSLATNLYGVPRATDDADFVVHLEQRDQLRQIVERLPSGIYLEPQASFETITASQKYVLRVRGSKFRLEVFLLTEDVYDQERFSRRYQIETSYGPAWVPTVEDVLVNKLLWAQIAKRPKDMDDIRNVVGVQQQNIDWGYVNAWCERHSTRELLDSIRQTIPPQLS